MEKEEIKEEMETLGIVVSEEQSEKFQIYMEELIKWNKKINLTTIIEPKEIILKHFVDSQEVLKYIKQGSKVIDVGTGAGFPGIPLKILEPSLEITLIDSLNKRIKFLEEIKEKLELKNVEIIHVRAEELSRNSKYREKFDVATSRAVANMNTLSEYLIPYVKIGGKAIFMKGPKLKEELEESKNAIKILGGEIEKIENFKLPNSEIERNNVIIKKIKQTPAKYPRKNKEIKLAKI